MIDTILHCSANRKHTRALCGAVVPEVPEGTRPAALIHTRSMFRSMLHWVMTHSGCRLCEDCKAAYEAEL